MTEVLAFAYFSFLKEPVGVSYVNTEITMGKTSFFRELFGKDKPNEDPNLEESLFLALMSCIPGQSWYTVHDSKGLLFDGYFLAGVNLPTGTTTTELPLHLFNIAEKTGASLLPLPFSSAVITPSQTINSLIKFASR